MDNSEEKAGHKDYPFSSEECGKRKLCQVMDEYDKETKTSYYCACPATTKCEKPPHWYLCSSHTVYALIAGWGTREIDATIEQAKQEKGE